MVALKYEVLIYYAEFQHRRLIKWEQCAHVQMFILLTELK